MEVFIVPTEGDEFEIEIGYFESMLEIKEKIERQRALPLLNKPSFSMEKVLEDDLDVLNSDIFIGSRIQLLVSSNTINNVMEMEEPRTPLILSNAFGGEDYRIDLSDDEEFDIDFDMNSALKMFLQENDQDSLSPETILLSDDEELHIDHRKSSALELEMVLQEIELYTDPSKSSALKMVLQEYEQELHGNHPMKGSTSTRPLMMTSLSPGKLSLNLSPETIHYPKMRNCT
ncbi:uncharacterized protein LOC124938226 [Impatiens glandulifera]|uniref:uncharacterized protein LOC124938226 n=1 Tax=Impatiens glandulifera TaxID=253017 RepID=UPI001FB08150|nr:uncharacterized protein LOC124938226 [Impatiens glandulifera]